MKKSHVLCMTALVAPLAVAGTAAAQCSYPDTPTVTNSSLDSCSSGLQVIEGEETYGLTVGVNCNSSGWRSDTSSQDYITLLGGAQCNPTQTGGPPQCSPHFYFAGSQFLGNGTWRFIFGAESWKWDLVAENCVPDGNPFPSSTVTFQDCTGLFCCGLEGDCVMGNGPYGTGGAWEPSQCNCYPATSPLLVDVAGDGYKLTDSAGGAMFDLAGTGERERVGWTSAGSDDAFLAWDRNDDGQINDARELFGEVTLQLPSSRPNGFEALRMLDANVDGVVDANDPDFARLQLWTDRNHNGRSEERELASVARSGIVAFSLEYSETSIRDMHGNIFKYRAALSGKPRLGRYVYDVFLVRPGTPVPTTP